MPQSKDPERLGNKEGLRGVFSLSPWEGKIEEILWVNGGMRGREHEGSGWRWKRRVLKEMTRKVRAFTVR